MIDTELFNGKEINNLSIKATTNFYFGERLFERGETILYFDKIMTGEIKTYSDKIIASGGKHNDRIVPFKDENRVQFNLVNGIISKQQLAFLQNAQKTIESIFVTYREVLESDENKLIYLKFPAVRGFAYTLDGEKIAITQTSDPKILELPEPYLTVIIDYDTIVNDSYTVIIGTNINSGFFDIKGLMSLKDEEDGRIKTAMIHIPRAQISSDLTIWFNSQYPSVNTLQIIGFPKNENNRTIYTISFLNDDLLADIL